MIALNSPLQPNLKKLQGYLEGVNNSGWYTNFGPLHNELTVKLEEYLGVKNLLLVSNATLGLQVAGEVLNSNSILTTPFSFVATVSAYKWQNKKIAFSDVERNSYNLCPNKVKKAFTTGSDADTILATHVYGNPCNVEAFKDVQKSIGCKIIYDAAQAFGVKIGNQSVLNYGDASVLSFHATKVFHTLEGGAVVFRSKDDYEKARSLINFGISNERGIVGPGINAKLNEYQAAVGLVNLEVMDDVIEHRAELFNQYRKGLNDVVEMPVWHKDSSHNGAYMPIRLKDRNLVQLLMKELGRQHIESRPYFYPSLNKVFHKSENFGSVKCEQICEGILCLPMHVKLKTTDVGKITELIKKLLT